MVEKKKMGQIDGRQRPCREVLYEAEPFRAMQRP